MRLQDPGPGKCGIGFQIGFPKMATMSSSRISKLIFARFRDPFVSNWQVDELNGLLLASLVLRTTLIVYFQLIMKIYRNWSWCLSRPSQSNGRLRKQFGLCSVPSVVLAQRELSLSVQFLFFLFVGTARRSLTKPQGGNIWIQKGAAKVKVDKYTQSASWFLSLDLF